MKGMTVKHARLFAVALVLVLPHQGEPSAPGWQFTPLSYLLPDQPRYPTLRNDGGASAGPGGVSWAADSPESGEALAFWDRSAVSYLTPIDPVPPDWPWGSVGSTSLFGSAIAFTLSDSWPLDAGPGEARYTFTEIFRLDGEGLARITWDNTSWRALPSIHGHRIAWQVRSAENVSSDDWEIELWDETSLRRVTDNDVEDTGPCLYEATLAWSSGGRIVYLLLPPLGDHGPLAPPVIVGPGGAPSLFKSKIAFHASDGHDMEILLYDVETGETLQLTHNDYDDSNPSLYDGTVAWQAYPHAYPLSRQADVFYWDGVTTHDIGTDPFLDEVAPSLWGTGLNTTVAYAEASTHATPYGSYVVCARRAPLSLQTTPDPGGTTITWPSLEGRTYRVEYSDDLITWQVAAESVPSAGYGETFWTDGPTSGTIPPPSEVSRRFYRVCENE